LLIHTITKGEGPNEENEKNGVIKNDQNKSRVEPTLFDAINEEACVQAKVPLCLCLSLKLHKTHHSPSPS